MGQAARRVGIDEVDGKEGVSSSKRLVSRLLARGVELGQEKHDFSRGQRPLTLWLQEDYIDVAISINVK